jgi:hypothetical protein
MGPGGLRYTVPNQCLYGCPSDPDIFRNSFRILNELAQDAQTEVSKRTNAGDKEVSSIEITDPIDALRAQRILSRRECWVDLTFSPASVQLETCPPVFSRLNAALADPRASGRDLNMNFLFVLAGLRDAEPRAVPITTLFE